MKKLRIFTTLLLSFVLGGLIAAATGLNPLAVSGGLFVSSFIPKGIPTGALCMAVNKEIWNDYIIGNLFKNNDFLNYTIDESEYVLEGSVVHIPQAGAPSRAVRNRTKLPATVTLRSDHDITYVLDEFTTDPRLIRNAETVELSYDKLNSCMSEDMMYLRQVVAEWMLYKWKPASFVQTTGSNVVAHYGTGDRKGMTLADLTSVKIQMNKDNILFDDRYCMLDTDMMSQLASDLKVTTTRDYSVVYDPINGTIKKLEGFTLIERSSVLVAVSESGVIYTPDETPASTACGVALCWQKASLAKALGTTKMFDSKDDPSYYGDLYSFLQRMGGRIRRSDNKGVLGIRQANGS